MAGRSIATGNQYQDPSMMAAGLTTSEMLRERFGVDDSASVTSAVTAQLKALYKENILPLEKAYNYDLYKEKPFSDGDFDAKPLVLVLGQSQTGKSTFIRHFLGRDFPGMKESSDCFSVLTYDFVDQIIPGHVVQSDPKFPFQGLGAFGNTFLQKFEVCNTNAEVLRDLWFIDTPGILSGARQRGRGYKFAEVVAWFAKKAARIILLFDHNKLEINSEFEMILKTLRDHRKKIRVVLNKASELSESELVLTYGSLMWSLCSAFKTPEEMKVYVSSFPEDPNQTLSDSHKCAAMFQKDSQDLLEELIKLPKEYAIEKMNIVRRRATYVKLHAQVLICMKQQINSMFGKRRKKMDMIDHIKDYLANIARELNCPLKKIEYMSTQINKDHLMTDNLKYKGDTKKSFEKLDNLINVGIPRLLKELSGGGGVDLERELVKMGLRKGRGMFAGRRPGDTGSRAPSKRTGKAGSVHSAQSHRSMFSVSSIKSKMFNPFKRSGSKAGSVRGGSTAGDSKLYNGPRASSRAFSLISRRNKQTKAIGRQGTQMSFVEQSVADREDLFSMTSDDDHLGLTKSLSPDEQTQMIAMIKERNRLKEQGVTNPVVQVPDISARTKSPSIRSPSIKSPSVAPSVKPEPTIKSPKSAGSGENWAVPIAIQSEAAQIFACQKLNKENKLTGFAARDAFAKYQMPVSVLDKIWKLVDIERSNELDEDQFALAIHLIRVAKKGEPLPQELPLELIPPGHRI